MAGIKDIVKQMDDAGKAFDGVITKTEKALYDAALTSVKELELDSQGNIKTTTANLKRLQAIKLQLSKAAGNKEYLKGVKELSDVFDRIYTRQQAYYYKSAFPEKSMGMNAKSKLELMRQVAVQNTIEGLTGAGLASNVTDPLNRILLRAVTSGEKYSDLTKELRDSIMSSPQGEGTLSRYAKTYATTALTQYAGQNNKLFTDDLGASWFRYVGSEIETTREFCQLMLQKEYIHRSEFSAILKGEITINGKVHKCKMNPKTGLPQGMIDGTNEDNLQVNVGGWNCRHQLVPVAAASVPQDIRDAVGDLGPKQVAQGQFSIDEFNKAFGNIPVKNDIISNKDIFTKSPIPQKNLHLLLHSATFKPETVDISDIIPVKANLYAPTIKEIAGKYLKEGTTGITAKGIKVGGKVYIIEGQADLAVKKIGGVKQTQMEIAEVSQAEFDKYANPAPAPAPKPTPVTKPVTATKATPTAATAPTQKAAPAVQLLPHYATGDDIADTMVALNKNKQLFSNLNSGLAKRQIKIEVTHNKGINGSTDTRGKIELTPARHKNVITAFDKITNGKPEDITHEEADAIAILWHEVTHNRHNYSLARDYGVPRSKDQTKYMELANEYVARKTLRDFYRMLGVDKMPFEELENKRTSTGYNKMVVSYQHVVKTFQLDEKILLETLQKELFEGRYDELQTGLAKALYKGGLSQYSYNKAGKRENITIAEIQQIVKLCKENYSLVGIERRIEREFPGLAKN